MNPIRRAVTQLCKRSLFGCLACACALAAAAQPPAQPAPSNPAPLAAASPAILSIDGPWRFQIGDDPRWADPAFDDSSWRTINLSQSLTDQGFPPYSGYAWYRIRLTSAQLGALAGSPSALLLSPSSLGQFALFINGVQVAQTRGMADPPSMYDSPPFTAGLPATGPTSSSIVLAVRAWAGPDTSIRRGLLTQVEAGASPLIADRLALATDRHWDQQIVAPLVITFLFLCVAGLGFALYLAQRHHSEYLWLALLCLSVAAAGSAETAWALSALPIGVYSICAQFFSHIFMAVTLEFVLRFTASTWRRTVRSVQIAFLLLPFIYLLHLQLVSQVLSVSAEVLFCALVCILLFRAWRVGRTDAGIMLLPFFLASTADSADSVLDFFASLHWLPDSFASHHFTIGPIVFGLSAVAYTVFLASLIAVILYRFIRVSQEEQRSNAEIAAARSVQALLIPTVLPSNKNFMLESAYLPVNGVGGDFFQVLPLQDESLLLVVGDVSGKGLQAAMNSSTLVGALRNETSYDPATILRHLNRVLIGAVATPGKVPELDAAPSFATCLCARIYADGTVTIANAGHLSPYRDGRELELLPGLPLGVIPNAEYEQSTFQLNRGDRIVFLSDGVVEASNAEGELFGFDRTRQVSHESARYIASTAQRFGQTDDITVVSIYVASRAAEHAPEEALHSS